VRQLLAVLARLAPEHPDLRLLAMGRTETWEQEFAGSARALGVADRVVTTGWLEGEELQAAYAATDVFATPSICFDTFGLVNLEAMEHRKPVVATAFGGSREVVRAGVTGFVENPFDVEAFAGRVAELLRDEGLRGRLGEAGYLRLVQGFTIERLADEYLEEYERARSGQSALHPGAAGSR
jgi:spore coat protein SA